MRDHVSDGRRQDSRVWALALAALILLAGLLFSIGINWRQHAPQPLLEFIEGSGTGPVRK